MESNFLHTGQYIHRYGLAGMESRPRNGTFYAECVKYFKYLRRRDLSDDGFEDEFFYTVPAMKE